MFTFLFFYYHSFKKSKYLNYFFFGFCCYVININKDIRYNKTIIFGIETYIYHKPK